ncbi:MAG: hypothetical protein NPINA01_05980 [Nitrospinaceae bacterium]|nr:MAG: hypothetical protein NPINA01_05980 [Nitrospinaceae bacterium]
MNSNSRFTNNNDGTITDVKTGLTWIREDSWQSDAKWVTWDEAKEHIMNLSDNKYCGMNDWRFPSSEEALTLYDPHAMNADKYGKEIHLDPIFPSGALPTIWTDEPMSGNEGYILDFRNGEIRTLYKSKSGRMAVRAVRGEMKKP